MIHFWQGAESIAPTTQNDASTSKNGPRMWCFKHFYFHRCFAPQRRALFEYLNFQNGVQCASTCASRHSGVQFFILSRQMALHLPL
jgi:hypothetical protein